MATAPAKARRMEMFALSDFPMVEPGDKLSELILTSLSDNGLVLEQGDVLVLAQKIVSKAENQYRNLNEVSASAKALKLAEEVDKDPRLVELILQESESVVRQRPGVLIVRHRLGFVHANAGIDQSNIETNEDSPRALLLPVNPDQSAAALRVSLEQVAQCRLNIVINDSAGRAWRNGTCGIAIGCAGFEPVQDLVGDHDMFGNELRVTTVGIADELAAAGSLLMGQAGEASPVVLIRGAPVQASSSDDASLLIRDPAVDLFL
ncbi:MAG: coenzyme F420-0:L-glutamate ligase [Pseudomonadales bacterium]